MIYNEQEKQQELKTVNARLMKIQIIGALGNILVGLAIYGIWGAQGDAFLTILNNIDVVYSMLVLGFAIMIWQYANYFPLIRKRIELTKAKP